MKEYFLFIDETVTGPFTLFQLKEKNINLETLIWTKESNSWLKAINYQEVSMFLNPNTDNSNIFGDIQMLRIKYFQMNISADKITQKFTYFSIAFWVSFGLLMLYSLSVGLSFLSESLDIRILFITIFSSFSFFLIIFPISFAIFFLLEFIYYGWRVIEGAQSVAKGSEAVGYLFIPFYNFYWVFVAIYSLAKENNRIMSYISPQGQKMSENIAITICILFILMFIPFIGFASVFPFMILVYLYVKQLKDVLHTELSHIEYTISHVK